MDNTAVPPPFILSEDWALSNRTVGNFSPPLRSQVLQNKPQRLQPLDLDLSFSSDTL